ncbi:MAG: group II intron maturase-specific domain-containing protein [Rhodothermales bacterium]
MRQGGKLLTKPSKKAVNAHIKQIKAYLRSHVQVPTLRVVKELTRVIRGWVNYYRHGASKQIFNRISHRTFDLLWKWARRRHRNKPNTWIRQKYFRADWAFHSKEPALLRHNQVPVTRFVKVTGKCSPPNPDEAKYWRARRNKRRECLMYKEVDAPFIAFRSTAARYVVYSSMRTTSSIHTNHAAEAMKWTT